MSRREVKDLEKEIMNLTSLLISAGISVNQEYPSIFKKHVSGQVRECVGVKKNDFDMSVMLNDEMKYEELHKELDEQHIYNFKFLDGALVSLYYEFDTSSELIKHRLTFFPSSTLYSLETELDMDIDLTEHIYADIISDNIYPIPIRFDYDPEACSEDHTSSHLTLGQYKNCRIPVSKPISPEKFLTFILKNFYYNIYKEKVEQVIKKSSLSCFQLECLDNEDDKKHHHLVF